MLLRLTHVRNHRLLHPPLLVAQWLHQSVYLHLWLPLQPLPYILLSLCSLYLSPLHT